MILDTQSLFSNNQVIKTTIASENVIDYGKDGLDAGWGETIPLLVQVTEKFVGLTSLTVALQASDTANFATVDTVYSETKALAALKTGARFALKSVPYGMKKRYWRLYYTVAGTATAGKITAGITMGNDETVAF